MSNIKFTKSIYFKLLQRFSLCIIIPFIIVIILLVLAVKNGSQARLYDVNIKVADQIEGNIQTNIDFTSRVTQTMLSNSELVLFISNDYNEKTDYDLYSTSIKKYVLATISADYRSEIRIYSVNNTIPMGMGVFYPLVKIEKNTVVSNFISKPLKGIWLSEQDFETREYNPYLFTVIDCFIYLEKMYSPTGELIGLITFSIPKKYFYAYSDFLYKSTDSEDQSIIINLTDKNLSDEVIDAISKDEETYSKYKRLAVYQKSTAGFPYKIIIINYMDMWSTVLKIVTGVMTLFFCLSAYIMLKSIKSLVSQMNQCINVMDDSISKEFQSRILESSDDEIGRISQRINILLDRIAVLIKLSIKKETASKEAQIIALQHQINPHFIYNTMEVFSSKMKLYKHYEESDAMVAFANIFRYNVNATKALVQIQDEIKQAYSYIDIEKLRYPNIYLDIDISSEILDVKIPKFIFQPLIENSIIHGCENRQSCLNIKIAARYFSDSNKILFKVSDDGKGISDSKAEALNKKLAAPSDEQQIRTSSSSIGLSNINTRLKLYYDDECHITICCNEDNQTIVSFFIKL